MNHRHSLITVLAFLIATGTHAELPPDSPVLKRLGELKSAFAAAVQNDASAAHELAVKDLNGKYAAALERAITSQTQAGKLDEALAVRAEKQLIDGQKALPADDADIAETLKPLRTTYRNTLAKLEADRDKRLAPLRAKYDQALAAYFAELTKAGDLDGALAVKAVRDALPSSQVPLAPKTTGPAPASRTAAPAATKAKAAKYDPAAAAKIIDWLFTCKGVAVVSTDGGKTTKEAKVTEDLPKGRFELIRIFHGHSSQTVPEEPFPWASLEGVPTLLELRLRQKQIVTAADVAHLAALSELTFLHLPSARIEDTAFDAFPLNPKVRHLIIYGTTFASEGSMAKLTASYPNLENLDINRCLPVTPELVRVGASLKKLTRFVTSGVVTAEVAKAIGAMPSLTEWVHTIGRVDDAMPPGVLASSLKNLTRLALGDLPNAKVLLARHHQNGAALAPRHRERRNRGTRGRHALEAAHRQPRARGQ